MSEAIVTMCELLKGLVKEGPRVVHPTLGSNGGWTDIQGSNVVQY